MRAMLMSIRRQCRTWMQRRADRRLVRRRLRQIEERQRDFELVTAFTRKRLAA